MNAAPVQMLSGSTSSPLSRVLEMLDCDGEEARIVGGAVRNALMGLPVGEVDIATTALPNEVVRRAGAAGFKPGADRHRARHGDGGCRRHSLRSHDPA